jgi:hypothetical protein
MSVGSCEYCGVHWTFCECEKDFCEGCAFFEEPPTLLDAVGEYLKSYQDHVSLKDWMKARDRLFEVYERERGE